NMFVILVAILAGSGGLLFGYDIGVTGGVVSMPSFTQKFFPDVYERSQNPAPESSPYCVYDDQLLQLFTSSLFLAGMFMSVFAAALTRKLGRKGCMFFASMCFLLGTGLNAGAHNLAMLVVGRIFLGFGIGAANTAVPLYLSEAAPHKYRGGLNMMFQLAVTIGILAAQLINYGTQEISWGWRLSLGLAGVPAGILLIGSIVLPETPNSLIERGRLEDGKKVLKKLRGADDVEIEYNDIVTAAQVANQVSMSASFKALFSRKYSPMTIVTGSLAMLQQLTGINAIMFYVPVIFASLGSGRSAALLNTVIIGAVNVVSTFVSIATVDKFGRRFLFLEGGIQMMAGLITTGAVLAVEFKSYTASSLPSGVAVGLLIVICVYVSAFAWSWGPLGWLVPSEVQSLETRPAGMCSAVFINFLFSFVIGQCFLSMMCTMEWGVFIFFAGWVFIMTCFVYWMLPETKGVPVESVPALFARHWAWKKLMGPHAQEFIELEQQKSVASLDAKLEAASVKY
ncbi:sugar porter family MFS transporter, partial [Providencia stuartii]|nr:sugar porter family MFS transporter [Providencia stuartii]